MEQKLAIVTGANRGIGFETTKQLSALGVRVILTARDSEKGEHAREILLQKNENVLFHQLDVTKQESVDRLLDYVQKEFGKLDILINNAGVFMDQGEGGLDADIDKVIETFIVNTIGPLRLCRAFIPLMIKNNFGRVVNVSSGMGQLTNMTGKWPGYRMSKAALNAVTRVFADEVQGKNITVNSVCPGWTKTDLGGPDAPRTPEEAADTILWLATLDANEPNGGFFQNREHIAW